MNAFLAMISTALNAYLTLDPQSKTRLQKLSGNIITIELLPFHFIFQCVFSENGVELCKGDTLQEDARITGTPIQMMAVMISTNERQRFFADDVTLSGNAEIAQLVVALFDELEIDWEEQLSHLIGDVPAYHVNQWLKGVRRWFKRSEQSFSEDLADYLHEEAAFFPPEEALQDFYHDIDVLRMAVDRMEARVKQLQSLAQEEPT